MRRKKYCIGTRKTLGILTVEESDTDTNEKPIFGSTRLLTQQTRRRVEQPRDRILLARDVFHRSFLDHNIAESRILRRFPYIASPFGSGR
jgi:hypothetical protein